jgi:hypothetical protein
MSDYLVLGGGISVYQPDALEDWSQGAESAGTLEAMTRPFIPPAPGSELPASESRFKRVYVRVTHERGFAFWLTPVLDGREITALRRYFSRPAPAVELAEEVVLPLGRASTRFPNVKKGLRGTSLALKFERDAPTSRFHLETLVIAYQPVQAVRGTDSAA